jgi:hypothetical protein
MEVAIILAAGRFIGPIVLKNIGVIASFIGMQALNASQEDHWLRLQEDVRIVTGCVKQVEQHVVDLRVSGFNNRDIFGPIMDTLKAIERRLCKAGKVFQKRGYQTTDPILVKAQCAEIVELTSPLGVLLQVLSQKSEVHRSAVLAAKGKSLFASSGSAEAVSWAKPDSLAHVGQMSAGLLREGMSAKTVLKAIERYLDRALTAREEEVLHALKSDHGASTTVVVHIKSAQHLRRADIFSKSDPYVTVKVVDGNQKTKKTKVIQNTLNPVWEQKLRIQGVRLVDVLRFSCYDWDAGQINDGDPLGTLELQVGKLADATAGELTALSAVSSTGGAGG